jgi:hypothetical protein
MSNRAMTGAYAPNPHEGSRSEILADYLFSSWGTLGQLICPFPEVTDGRVGQVREAHNSNRRCKSCPHNQTFLGLRPSSPSPVTVENCLRRSSNAALSRQYEA